MFGLGSKKKQREILGDTISEIRELRADLSALKEQLKMILPAPDKAPGEEMTEGDYWDCGEMSDGEVPGLGNDYFPSCREACFQEQEESGCNESIVEPKLIPHSLQEVLPVFEESACGVESAGQESGRTGEEIEVLRQCEEATAELDEEEAALPETGEKSREWAVVDYSLEKRPWWKLWGARDRQFGKSV